MYRPSTDMGYLDMQAGDEIPNRVPPTVELGVTGLRRIGGYVEDEFVPQLRGRKAVQIYREMADNSAIVSAWFNTVSQLVRQIEWRVEPASSSSEDRKNAEFLEQNMDDMEHSFGDFIVEMLSLLIYGWSLAEIVFKRRNGLWATDKANHSAFDDNQIGWRKMPIRAQETLLRWIFAENGDVEAMVQLSPPYYKTVVLPMTKCLLFRNRLNKGNPEGYSPLRGMWRSWFMIKRFEEIEAVGIERDLTGLPVGKLPASYLNAKPGTKEYEMVQAFKKMVTAVRRNEQEGLVIPTEYDPDTKQPLFDFELLTSGGTRQFDLDGIITRYETRMLQSVLSDFIMTGHEDSGASYALHTDKSGIFETGCNFYAQSIAEVLNRDAVPPLFALNGNKPKALPKIVPNDVNPPDLTQLAEFMTALAQAGVQWFPDPVLEAFLRDAARLPAMDETVEKQQEQAQKQQAIIGLAQQRLEALQIGQQAAAGQQQMEQGEIATAQAGSDLKTSQAAAQAAPGAEPVDPEKAKQSKIATQRAGVGLQQDKTKLAGEKQKVTNLKKPAPKASKTVKKSMTNVFGIEHGEVR
jgi:hypothetical protein